MYLYFYLSIKIYFSTETSVVCDRSKSFHGFLGFLISYICYIVEMSLSLYMCMLFLNLVT